MSEQHQDTLLIIEDVPANIGVLLDFFHRKGFRVLIAVDGKEGLEVAQYAKPDLILLDIMLPDLDGFTVCQRLKANPELADIPVIFMTALNETVDKLKGFELGAADYVTKPIQHEEVMARVSAHLKLLHLQNALRDHADALEQRNQELETFSRTVAHDLKTPLNGIIGFSRLLTALPEGTPLETGHLQDLQWVLHAAEKMTSIIESLLLLAKVGASSQLELPIEALDMGMILESVQERLSPDIKRTAAEVDFSGVEEWPIAAAYAPWVEEVWVNYLSNALKYGGQPPVVSLGAVQEDSFVRFWVKDNGEGLDEVAQSYLFTPFTRLQNDGEGHGLGLTIVKKIIEKLGGNVGVHSQPGAGSEFYFRLPFCDLC